MESKNTRIPKIIHYCWFGGNTLPENVLKCIESWKKYCPDYEIIEWNELNFEVDSCVYAKEAYAEKKWAFVSDVARLSALVNHGGIYMDTDIEVLRPLDEFLNYEAFSGFETMTEVSTGIMACEKGHELFQEFLRAYEGRHFRKESGELDMTPNVAYVTQICKKYGLKLNNEFQTVNGYTIFPKEYFSPKDYATDEINLTENTFVIHHYEATWLDEEFRYTKKIRSKLVRRMPRKFAFGIARVVGVLKYRGFVALCEEIYKKLKAKTYVKEDETNY